MKKFALAIAVISCAAVLTGCASRQFGEMKVNNDQIIQSIQTEKVSKKDVWIKLGQPHRVIYSETNPNQSEWHYYILTAKRSGIDWIPIVGIFAGGENVRIKENIIYFEGDVSVKAEKKLYDSFKNDWATIAQQKYTDDLEEKELQVKAEMEKLNIPFDSTRAINVKNIDMYIDENDIVIQ